MIVDRPGGRGKLLSAELIAQTLGVGYRTLRPWSRAGKFPEPVRIGRRHSFAEATARPWTDSRRPQP